VNCFADGAGNHLRMKHAVLVGLTKGGMPSAQPRGSQAVGDFLNVKAMEKFTAVLDCVQRARASYPTPLTMGMLLIRIFLVYCTGV